VIKELIIKHFLCLDGTSNIILIESHPDAALCARLLNVNLLNFSEISTHQLYLVFDVDVKARFFLQINFL
jgi:hypothetical protein